jgi:hypothetical protein
MAVSVLTSCLPFYRYQSAACKQRGLAYAARVEKLRRDARERLIMGAKKDAVIQFFAENGNSSYIPFRSPVLASPQLTHRWRNLSPSFVARVLARC